MKNYLLFLCLLLISNFVIAKGEVFSSVEDVLGESVYVSDNAPFEVAYTFVDGKMKLAKKSKNVSADISNKTYCVEQSFFTFKKKEYLVLRNKDFVLCFRKEEAFFYLPSFRSVAFWKSKCDSIKDNYSYFDTLRMNIDRSKITDCIIYDSLIEIQWDDYQITPNGCNFQFCAAKLPSQKFSVSYQQFEKNRDYAFLTNDGIQPYVERYNQRIAYEKRLAEIKDSIENHRIRLAVMKSSGKYGDFESPTEVEVGDTIAIFSFENGKFCGQFRYATLMINPSDLRFLDEKSGKSQNAEFLKLRGENGADVRFSVAEEYDNEHTGAYISGLFEQYVEIRLTHKERQINQTIITKMGYEYDGSQFGMSFGVYNCYKKSIKYIEFTITNYNAVGDVQRDDLGRSSKTVRGIGPIEPEEECSYSWDDIFWDDRDIIAKSRLTGLKLTFMDGTTKVFSGYQNVQKHVEKDAWGK